MIQSDEFEGVIYGEPLAYQVSIALQAGFAVIVLTLMASGIMWGLMPLLLWPLHTPWWWHMVAAAATLGVACGVFTSAAPYIRRRLTMGETGVTIAGIMGRRAFTPYDDVRLVQLEERASNAGVFVRLIVHRSMGKPCSLIMQKGTASECVAALHEFCESAGALDEHDQMLLPRRAERNAAAGFHAATLLRRKAWAKIATVIVAVPAMILYCIFMYPSGRVSPAMWIGVPVFLIGGGRLLFTARETLRKAKALEGATRTSRD